MKKRGSIRTFHLKSGGVSYGGSLRVGNKTYSKRGFKEKMDAEKWLEAELKKHPYDTSKWKSPVGSSTNCRGISIDPRSGKYIVKFVRNEKPIQGGSYETLDEALRARDELVKAIAGDYVSDWQDEHLKFNLKPGSKFGEFTVIEKTNEIKQHSSVIKARCSCGKICYVLRKHLVSGETRSCGHLRSKTVKGNIKKSQKRVNEIVKKYDGTFPSLLKDEARKDNQATGYRHIKKTKYGRFMVQLVFKGKYFYGGTYETLSDALFARNKLREKLWGNIPQKWKNDPLNNHKK